MPRSRKKKTPAEYVIELFEGAANVADILGLERTTIYRWTYAKENGGRDGRVPSVHHEDLLAAAKKQKRHLKPEHLVVGA